MSEHMSYPGNECGMSCLDEREEEAIRHILYDCELSKIRVGSFENRISQLQAIPILTYNWS